MKSRDGMLGCGGNAILIGTMIFSLRPLTGIFFSLLPSFSLKLQRTRMTSALRPLVFLLAASAAAFPVLAQFGDGNGIVRLPKSPSNSTETGESIALQSDGKVVIAGNCGTGPCVARLNSDGTLDTTFNASGAESAIPGKAIVGLRVNLSRGSARVVIDDVGRIVYTANCRATINAKYSFCAARFNTDGSLDTSFVGPAGDGAGKFLFDINSSDNIHRDAHFAKWTTATGEVRRRYLLVGSCGPDQCIAALDYATGAYDEAFEGPVASSPNGRFAWRTDNTFGNAVAVITQNNNDNNGKIVVAGSCDAPNQSICLTKFNTDGTFDVDFDGPTGGGNGSFILRAFEQNGTSLLTEAARDIVEADDGRFLLLCNQRFTGPLCIYRLNRDGSLDQTFDSGLDFPTIKGRVVFNFAGSNFPGVAVGLDRGLDAPLGRPISLADCAGVCLTKFSGTAQSDTSFVGPGADASGQFFFEPGFGPDEMSDMVVNAAGEIFVVGRCNGSICVIKFKRDGALDTSACVGNVDGIGTKLDLNAVSDGLLILRSMLGVPGTTHITRGLGYDIDGDGVVSAATDGLMIVRRMFGLVDTGVIGGINFASYANRKTWPQIESYLRKRCQIPFSPVSM
jgi:uncharacterized delta-60 repeat protein